MEVRERRKIKRWPVSFAAVLLDDWRCVFCCGLMWCIDFLCIVWMLSAERYSLYITIDSSKEKRSRVQGMKETISLL